MKRAFFLALFLVLSSSVVMVVRPAPVQAACNPTPDNPCDKDPLAVGCTPTPNSPCKCPAGTVEIALPITGNNNCVDNKAGGGAIINYLRLVLQVLSGVVGMVVVLMLIIAGIQYITSYGDPANIKAAKTRIINAITALILFLMMAAILQFLVPGGIL